MYFILVVNEIIIIVYQYIIKYSKCFFFGLKIYNSFKKLSKDNKIISNKKVYVINNNPIFAFNL